jgi:hypothetical protein
MVAAPDQADCSGNVLGLEAPTGTRDTNCRMAIPRSVSIALANGLAFSGERHTDPQSHHGREEPRAQPPASRHGPRASERRRRSSAAPAC